MVILPIQYLVAPKTQDILDRPRMPDKHPQLSFFSNYSKLYTKIWFQLSKPLHCLPTGSDVRSRDMLPRHLGPGFVGARFKKGASGPSRCIRILEVPMLDATGDTFW